MKGHRRMSATTRSYLHEFLHTELADAVGEENVSTSESDKIAYSCDYYWIPELWADRGCRSPQPDFVVHPRTAEEVARICRIANSYKIPLTAWGGGSGSQGGALPIHGGIVLDTKKLNRILAIDKASLTVTAETGIIMQHLEWALEQEGFSTMHIPASIGCATLGGFLAHRGTGVLSTKYGKIEDMIMSLEAVLPDGTIIETLPVPRHASGPDLNQLFLGSEGTLGVMTKATLKIHPLPEVRRFHAFVFPDLHAGLEAGRQIMARRLRPSVIRLYDEAETRRLIRRVLGIEKEGAYLVFGFDGDSDMVELEMRKALAICRAIPHEDLGPKLGEDWWEHRYDFFFPNHMFHLPQAFGTLDTVATFADIENVYRAMKGVIEGQFPMARYIGHFSHWYEWGCMLYARFIVDSPPEDPHEAAQLYNRIWDACLRAAMKEGGLLNEHHGIGLKLGRLMRELYGPAYGILEKIKKSLDPNNLMNPGKMGFETYR
jgi:alkyldihydroxyacetonephosphate synthase